MCKTTKKYLRTSVESSNAESLAYPLRGARQSLLRLHRKRKRGFQGPPSLRKYFFSSLFPLLLIEENTEKNVGTPSCQRGGVWLNRFITTFRNTEMSGRNVLF